MQTRPALALAALAFALAPAPPAEAIQQRTGRTPGGAYFQIAAPDQWKAGDPLVLYQHGFNFEVDDSPGLGPLRDLLLQQGIAVAASGYRQRGWALFTALDDNAELLERFTEELGAPGPIFTFGGSMGGLIALKLAEDPRFADQVKGVYAVCPPAGGAKTWDAAFDLKFAYDSVCAATGKLPRGSAPHEWALDLDDIPDNLDDPLRNSDLLDAVVPVSLCTGLNFPDSLETGQMRDARNRLMQFSGASSEDTLTTLLAYAIFGTADVLRAPDKMAGRSPWQNARSSVSYNAAYWNEVIPRIEKPDPFAGLDFRRRSSLYGSGSAKIVSLHTSRDEIVVPEHQTELRALYPASRLTQALTTETAPTHCGFEAPEIAAGWEALRRWVAGTMAQPTPATLQQGCQAAVAQGIAGVCRIAPADTTGPLSDKIAARNFQPAAGVAGSWYEPARSGEGFLLEIDKRDPSKCVNLDLCNGSVSWFTYPPANEAGEQRWIVGATRAEGTHWLVVDDARLGTAGSFAGAGTTAPWGRLDFEFYADGRAAVRHDGPPAYGDAIRPLTQLSALGPRLSYRRQQAIEVTPDLSRTARSGSYYDAANPGSGFMLQIDPGDYFAEPTPTPRALIVFYTYDAQGAPLWLTGEGTYLDAATLSFEVARTRGADFGTGPITTPVERVPWGEVVVRFASATSCVANSIEWRPIGTGIAAGLKAVTRLTEPLPTSDLACRP